MAPRFAVAAESAVRRDAVAVVDIGSNSLRLVVFDGLKRPARTLFNEKVLCGLGRSLNKTGKLDAEGVEMARANMTAIAEEILPAFRERDPRPAPKQAAE